MSRDPLQIFSVEGRVAVVTGASSGIGARFASVLARGGAKVVIGARRTDRLAELADQLTRGGHEVSALGCDVRSRVDVERLVEAAIANYGRLDVMVNNAGVAPPEDDEIESEGSFQDVLAVNATGVFLGARAAARKMLAGGGGAIINIASINGLVGGADTPSYAASKGAVVNLTRELGVRWARRGIRVNAIAPGWFRTEMTAAELDNPESHAWVVDRTPVGRPGLVEELDGALLFLASDASSYVTGQTLVIDGGWTSL
jgi:NAD(P)-dependent dehydrogenase (short-subunit alcohol dehydrogenase family)